MRQSGTPSGAEPPMNRKRQNENDEPVVLPTMGGTAGWPLRNGSRSRRLSSFAMAAIIHST